MFSREWRRGLGGNERGRSLVFAAGVPPRLLISLLAALFVFGCVLSAPLREVFPRATSSVAPDDGAKEAVATGHERDVGVAVAPSLLAGWNEIRGDAYALDAVERFIEAGVKRTVCDPSGLLVYRGQRLRYQGPLTVHAAFQERLERFETVAAEVAVRVYGRTPRRIVHFGAYSCRSSRNRSYRLSEHALGNAVDIVGFDFGPATKTEPLPAESPRQLRQAFQVRVAKHWSATGSPVTERHRRFLRELTDELRGRSDIFRGLIGPADPKHADHFHFDVSPWRYVRL